jgi:hypothetical protein
VLRTRHTLVHVFERFTDRARRVVVLAQEEARLLGHNYIGTEHLLLGLVHEGEGVAAEALGTLGIELSTLRLRVEERAGHGAGAVSGHIPFTPRAKKVLELSLREALQLGHNHIGTEHILLGLVREGDGVGARVLIDAGVDLPGVRATVIQLLSGFAGRTSPQDAPPPFSGTGGPPARSCSFCGRELSVVDRYIAGSDAVICDVCAVAARQAFDDAPTGERLVTLPPRVLGDPSPNEAAVEDIQRALRLVLGGSADEDAAPWLEDGETLVPVRTEVRRRFTQVNEGSVRLDRVRFEDADRAAVRFTVMLGGAGGIELDGELQRANDRWQLTRETFCRISRMAGVECPPPEEPAG